MLNELSKLCSKDGNDLELHIALTYANAHSLRLNCTEMIRHLDKARGLVSNFHDSIYFGSIAIVCYLSLLRNPSFAQKHKIAKRALSELKVFNMGNKKNSPALNMSLELAGSSLVVLGEYRRAYEYLQAA